MTILGKYELHEEIGRGGFATVYRATYTVTASGSTIITGDHNHTRR
jgi:hypothetical protein